MTAFRSTTSQSSTTRHTASRSKPGVQLTHITTDRDESTTEIDIVAIHGLDTQSPGTWTWRPPAGSGPTVNWLADVNMLPSQVAQARIFTCDWPAGLFQSLEQIEMAMTEYARLVLEGIQREVLRDDARAAPRPILFIASCVGGLLLVQALVVAAQKGSSYSRVYQATRGIVFLATPFRGTSLQYVAKWAEGLLKAQGLFKRQKLSKLFDSVMNPTFELTELVSNFTNLCNDPSSKMQLASFYEGEKTTLMRKLIPGIAISEKRRLLVDKSSATLDTIRDPVQLVRNHCLMNKFSGTKCPDYETVAGRIKFIAAEILAPTLLNRADKSIQDNCYTEERLTIERLSGKAMPMEQCYINLNIITREFNHQDEVHMPHNSGSAFSLSSRQEAKMPSKTQLIELATLFKQRDGKVPRRIMIRGQAGVGKTTLCKKIIYSFYHHKARTNLWTEWTSNFDRILWIPLRHLKEERHLKKYIHSFYDLFYNEFFSLTEDKDLAKHLSESLPVIGSRTLFLLDGLDEILSDLDGGGNSLHFLKLLLNQRSVIITSRPSAEFPPGLQPLDLELETVGFYQAQVEDYIKMNFTAYNDNEAGRESMDAMLGFLKQHELMRNLVRIPIQLEALCYTWEQWADANLGTVSSTMTGIYIAIERKLWAKDVVKLGMRHDGNVLTADHVRGTGGERLASDMRQFLELLAFSGFHRDQVEFDPDYQDMVLNFFDRVILPDKQLPQLSFLRTSTPPWRSRARTYHFIHLTFQEYFAARYFVRQWKSPERRLYMFEQSRGGPTSSDPRQYVSQHKYTPRYEVFWRFVIGLLDAEGPGHTDYFIDIISQPPLDLFGSVHHRLIMRCLIEGRLDPDRQRSLEHNLGEWLLLETIWKGIVRKGKWLVSSHEDFPAEALNHALRRGSESQQRAILQSLSDRTSIPKSTFEEHVKPRLTRDSSTCRSAFRALVGLSPLPDNILDFLIEQLLGDSKNFRDLAVTTLRNRSHLPQRFLDFAVNRLKSKEPGVLEVIVESLGRQSRLPWSVLECLVECSIDEDSPVYGRARELLGKQETLPDEVFELAEAKFTEGTLAQNLGMQLWCFCLLEKRRLIRTEHLLAMAVWINSLDNHTSWKVLGELDRHIPLPNEVLQSLSRGFSEPPLYNDFSRPFEDCSHLYENHAAMLLTRHKTLDKGIIMNVAAGLNSANPWPRHDAILVLSRQSSLYDDILLEVAVLMNDAEEFVQLMAVKVVGMQLTIRDRVHGNMRTELLMRLMSLLSHVSGSVQTEIIRVLCGLQALPDGFQSSMQSLQAKGEFHFHDESLVLLNRRIPLSDWAAAALIERLPNISADTRVAFMRDIASAPEKSIDQIYEGLKDPEPTVRKAALDALQGITGLPFHVIEQLFGMIYEASEAFQVILRQSTLCEYHLQKISKELLRPRSPGSRSLIEVLRKGHESFFPRMLNSQYAPCIYKILLHDSFRGHVSLCIEGNSIWFGLPEGIKQFYIDPKYETKARFQELHEAVLQSNVQELRI